MDGILVNQVDSTIIEMIINLSRILAFKVISEGVETTEQLEFLKKIGCHEFQGYILSKPRLIEDIELIF